MLECRPIITKHLSWQVGNGEIASFWHDSWNGMEVLHNQEGVEDLIQIMEVEWGETIDCYVEKKHSVVGAS